MKHWVEFTVWYAAPTSRNIVDPNEGRHICCVLLTLYADSETRSVHMHEPAMHDPSVTHI